MVNMPKIHTLAPGGLALTLGSEELPPITTDDLRQALEWAGMTLLSMGIRSPLPKGPQSAWPAFASDANIAYGYSGERLRPALPSGRDIELMEKVLTLPAGTDNLQVRRLLHARALVAPISNRHLYSWSKLAFMLHTDRRKVVRMHHNGLADVVAKLDDNKIHIIRQTLHRLSS